MFAPLPLSLLDRITTTLKGQVTEYFDSKFVSKGPGREVTRVTSFGSVKVLWNVMTKNTAPFGYSFESGSEKGNP